MKLLSRSVPAVCLLAVLLTGCVKNKVLIRVNPDGSGNIVVTRVFSKQAVAMFEAQMQSMRDQMDGSEFGTQMPDDPFFNEDALRQEAGRFGPAVHFVKARKYTRDGARGSVALYEFGDIADVFVNASSMGLDPEAAGTMMMESDEIEIAEQEDDAYEFALTRGDVTELRITLPDMPEAPEAEDDAEEEDEEYADDEMDEMFMPAAGPQPAPEMDAGAMMMGGGNPFGFSGGESSGDMMRKMFDGMELSLAVEVNGKGVETDATHRHASKPQRVILFELNFGELLSSAEGKGLVDPEMMYGSESPLDMLAGKMDLPGVKVETKPAVVIRFR